MKTVVTGAAGFIGSHLCERLLQLDHVVNGVDCFIPYYDPAVKEANLMALLRHPRFRLHQVDLRTDALDECLEDADYVIHLAAMPGLVQSWTHFDDYMTCNVLGTQRLLEAVRRADSRLQRFLLGSTSSVYGRYASGDESLPTRPVSPYGLTKLAAENLCRAYADGHGLPLVVLRFFSVYGPRQRPDMAYNRFIRAILADEPVVVYGDGQQVRGNTYVHDCVAAVTAALNAPIGETYNVGGGEVATVWDILHKLEALTHRQARVEREATRAGDQRYTFADTAKLQKHTGWQPQTPLDDGLAQQVAWQRRQVTGGVAVKEAA